MAHNIRIEICKRKEWFFRAISSNGKTVFVGRGLNAKRTCLLTIKSFVRKFQSGNFIAVDTTLKKLKQK